MQLETGSSSSCNKSLCFSPVSVQHQAGYWPSTTTNGWKLPEDPPFSSLPKHRRSQPPSLPNVSHKSNLTQAQMLRILDIRMEKFTVILDRGKKMPYSFHNSRYYLEICSCTKASVLHRSVCAQACVCVCVQHISL